jgi:rhodanese-related sulfurtransferase
MKSKKILFVALDQFFATDHFTKGKLKAKGISDETYGRDSRIYVHCDTAQERKQLERFLKNEGFRVHTDYWPGSATAEVSVSYFRGTNWDE